MSWEFKPARRTASKVLIGLVGPSRSGKTFSALEIATGLVSLTGGRIAVIDTEGDAGRALHYAPPGDHCFEFDHLKLNAPYSAERYLEAFRAAEAHVGSGVVIIDSCSAEHEDEGGALEQHVKITGGDHKKNMVGWAEIRPKQRRLLAAIKNSAAHVICCFRAEDKTGVGKDGKPLHIGWEAVGWKRWPYELDICIPLGIHQKGVPVLGQVDWGDIPINMSSLVPLDRPLSRDVGRALAEWAGSGEPRSTRPAMVTLWLGPSSETTTTIREAALQLGQAVREAPSIGRLNALLARNEWTPHLGERFEALVAERTAALETTEMET